MRKRSDRKIEGSQVSCRSFLHEEKDIEYQAEALRMEEKLAKARARAKVYDNVEGVDLGIGKDTSIFAKEIRI